MDTLWDDLLDVFSEIDTTPIERRGIMSAFLPSMLQAGLSGRTSHQIFRDNNLGINNTDFGALVTEIKYSGYIDRDLFYLPSDTPISDDHLRIGNNSFQTRYKTVFSYGITDADGNFLYNTSHGIDTDLLGNKEAMEQLAMQDILERYDFLEGNIQGLTLRAAFFNDTL